MAACFASLCNDGIDARGFEVSCLLNRRRRREDARAISFERTHDRLTWSAEMRGEHGYTLIDHDGDLAIEIAERIDRIWHVTCRQLGVGWSKSRLQCRDMLGNGSMMPGAIEIEV